MIEIHITITGDKTGARIQAKHDATNATTHEMIAARTINQGINASVDVYNSRSQQQAKIRTQRVQDSWVQEILDKMNAAENGVTL